MGVGSESHSPMVFVPHSSLMFVSRLPLVFVPHLSVVNASHLPVAHAVARPLRICTILRTKNCVPLCLTCTDYASHSATGKCYARAVFSPLPVCRAPDIQSAGRDACLLDKAFLDTRINVPCAILNDLEAKPFLQHLPLDTLARA